MKVYSTIINSPLGKIRVTCNDKYLLGVGFILRRSTGSRRTCPERAGASRRAQDEKSRHPILRKAARQLKEYFSGQRKRFSLPLCTGALPGTDFQKKVWRCLTKIPHGQTVTYARLAKMAGSPRAYRAAGGANGRNPLPIIIPCHRVVASNGLGGFSSGVWRKRKLLSFEMGG
jgi:methylated-DNA-[protein]-cysteine S-methyltransferase